MKEGGSVSYYTIHELTTQYMNWPIN